MGLELRRGRGGQLRLHWYGRVVTGGKARVVNLNVKVLGEPPTNLRGTGDEKFEASREEAQKEFVRVQTEAGYKGRAAHLTERVIEAKTGRKIEYVRLNELANKWRKLGRENRPTGPWLTWCDTVFSRFAAAVPCEYLHEVTPEQAADYIECLRKDYARKTAKDVAQMLKSAFARFLPLGTVNPFECGISRKSEEDEGDTVHRRPFTAPELAALFEAARPDRFLFPLVVTAACTGLRRGDVCRLLWKAVDLKAGVIAVKTSKTGAGVEIPIFQPLREVLETALAEREEGAAYVFPDAALMVKKNPDGLTWRFKKLVALVLPDPEAVKSVPAGGVAAERVKLADVLDEVIEAVQAKMDGERCERVVDTLKLYAVGDSVRDIEKKMTRARSGVSLDLHRAEELSGKTFMPKSAKGGGMKGRVDRVTRLGERPHGTERTKPEGRARRASILDWHALRVTWVTLALAAGVPMEVARLVTGHKTVEVVLKHYFKPGREHLRTVLGDKLPDVLTGGKPAALPEHEGDHVAEIAAQFKGLNKADRARLAKMLQGA